MTISSTVDQATYTADGTSTVFPFSYPFFAPSDLLVQLINAATFAGTTPALNGTGAYDYTVSGTQDAATGEYLAGGSVVFNTAPLAGNIVAIQRAVPATQSTVFNDNALLPAKAFEAALDRLTMLVQQIKDMAALALSVPPFDPAIGSLTLPPAVARANQVLSFSNTGVPVLIAMANQSAQTVTALGGALAASLAQRFSRSLNVTDDFGAVGNGVTDDSAAIQACLNAQATLGGGEVRLAPLVYYVGPAGLTIPPNVTLKGMDWQPGEPTDYQYVQQPFTIILSTAGTIRLSENACITGLNLLSSAVFTPQSYRACITLISAFAGTGITVAGTDCRMRNLFVGGFNYGIYSSGFGRLHIDFVKADCTNGILIDNSHDTSRVSNVHLWDFLTTPWVNSVPAIPVSGVINNGAGLMRIETSEPHGLITGDIVSNVGIVGTGYTLQGPAAPNLRWTVTVASATTFDLTLNGAGQASAFAGTAYTSGGTVYLIGGYRKSGVGFYFSNSEAVFCSKLVCFGWDIGAYFGTGASWVVIDELGVDNYDPAEDPYTVGIYFDSTSSACSVNGGVVSSQGIAIRNNSTNTNIAHMIANLAFSNNGGAQPFVMWLQQGRIVLTNCSCDNSPNEEGVIRIEDAVTVALFTGCDINGVPFQFASVQGTGQNATKATGCSGNSQVLIGVDGGSSGSLGLLGATNYAKSKSVELIGVGGQVTQTNIWAEGGIVAEFTPTGTVFVGGITCTLPTSNPHVVGMLYNNAGVVTVSAG